MIKADFLTNKPWKVHLLLIFCTSLIYLFYFHDFLFHLNTLLTSVTDDSLKNYYTFVYHIKNDDSLLHFSGFNYPFGEHVVYTDCQPLLTFILQYLPFTHGHLIGILHFLIFFTFVISPSILYLIFIRLNLPGFAAFFISIAITLISPQFYRIYCGHYALAYNCLIPASILLLMRFMQTPIRSRFLSVFLFNTLLFLIHPYFGLGLSLFTFISLFLFEVVQLKFRIRPLISTVVLGILPILLFKVFMLLSDTHPERSNEPFGMEHYMSSISSLVIPYFDPFKGFLEGIFKVAPASFEGYAYLGLTMIILTNLFIVVLPFFINKTKIRKEMLALFLASFLLWLLSLGIHLKIQEITGLKITALNQFRAIGRFTWFLYFTLPLLVIPFLYQSLQRFLNAGRLNLVLGAVAILFFSVNLLESHYYFRMYRDIMWNYRNIFLESSLNAKEKKIIAELKVVKPQAILPLPVYFLGSEVYDRSNPTNPMIISSIYSYHCRLPIASSYASRTSVPETEEGIQILNPYKKDKRAAAMYTEQPFFLFKTHETILEDEKRLFRKVKLFDADDSTQFGFISKADILRPVNDSILILIPKKNLYLTDSTRVVYIEYENKTPFLSTNFLKYEIVYVIDSNKIIPGKYNVSLHYHVKSKTFRDMSGGLIVTRTKGSTTDWMVSLPIKLHSGFYKDYGVIEYVVELEKNYKYEFMINGGYDVTYHVSNFLLRPSNTSVGVISSKNDTIFNNYPRY